MALNVGSQGFNLQIVIDKLDHVRCSQRDPQAISLV